MIKSFRLGNFKAFAETQHIPIRPITIIFGANSAGKSSILHGLTFANEVMRKENLDVFKTELGGDSIDLGGFHQFVHRANDHNRISLSFDLVAKELGSHLGELFGTMDLLGVTVEIGMAQREIMSPKAILNPQTQELEWTDVPTGRYETGSTPKVLSYGIGTQAGSILTMSRRPNDTMQLDVLNQDHPAVRKLIESLILSFTTTASVNESDWDTIGKALAELVPNLTAQCPNLLPKALDLSAETGEGWKSTLLPLARGTREIDLTSALEFIIPRSLDELLQRVHALLDAELHSLVYLGPLRSYPARFLHLSQNNDPNWNAGGGYAWDLVLENAELRGKVNDWLSDPKKLSTPYKLEAKKLYDLANFIEAFKAKLSGDELQNLRDYFSNALQQLSDMEEQHGKVVPLSPEQLSQLKGLARLFPQKTEWEEGFPYKSIDEMRSTLIPFDIALNLDYGVDDFIDEHFETLAPLVTSDLTGKEYLALTDQKTGTVVTHRDVGIGISQVLPVLVYCFANQNKTIAIEQPEIHLHPGLQAELGDVFIESALGERKNAFLLETHSEHLILRILRRIRETTDGTIENAKFKLRPEDVSVVYVRAGMNGSVVQDIEITPEGEFASRWPEGFFDDRAKELF